MLELLLQFSGVAWLGGQVQVPGTQLAVNLVLVDQLADFLYRVEAELPETLGGLQPDPFFDAGLIRPLAGADMPAISARGAPANPLGLQEHHVIALFLQVQGRREAGVAAANHAHIGSFLAF